MLPPFLEYKDILTVYILESNMSWKGMVKQLALISMLDQLFQKAYLTFTFITRKSRWDLVY